MILLGSVLTVLVCAFAIRRGDTPERATAGIFLVVLAGSIAAQLIVGAGSAWPVVGADLCLGAGLVALCFLHPRTWLYVAISLCAGLLLVHSFLLEEGAIVTRLYRVLVNSFNVALLITLAAATLATLRKRQAAGVSSRDGRIRGRPPGRSG